MKIWSHSSDKFALEGDKDVTNLFPLGIYKEGEMGKIGRNFVIICDHVVMFN